MVGFIAHTYPILSCSDLFGALRAKHTAAEQPRYEKQSHAVCIWMKYWVWKLIYSWRLITWLSRHLLITVCFLWLISWCSVIAWFMFQLKQLVLSNPLLLKRLTHIYLMKSAQRFSNLVMLPVHLAPLLLPLPPPNLSGRAVRQLHFIFSQEV